MAEVGTERSKTNSETGGGDTPPLWAQDQHIYQLLSTFNTFILPF